MVSLSNIHEYQDRIFANMLDEDPWRSLWSNHPTPSPIFLGIFVNILPHRCLMFARIPVQYSRVECVSNNLAQRCQIFLGIGRVFLIIPEDISRIVLELFV